MSLHLETRGLTKRFGRLEAVSKIHLAFEPGQIHAVLGENGAGKSTLMKLLFGLESPTEGRIFLNGRDVRWRSPMDAIEAGLGMVQQHFSLVENLSAIDNIMLGAERVSAFGRLDRKGAIEALENLLPSDILSVPWLEKVENLSVGFKQRIEILKLLFRKAEILFLDEPTAVLTPQEVTDFFCVLRELRKAGRTIVLVTHKINEVMSLCDTYAILRQGRLVDRGCVADVTADDLVEKMIGRKLKMEAVTRCPARADVALMCKGLHETGVRRGRMKDVTLEVHKGEIVGIAGVEGSGQSHLVDALMGLRRFEGQVSVLGSEIVPLDTVSVRNAGVGLVPEDRLRQGLWPDESCYHNMIIGLESGFVSRGLLLEKSIEETTSDWARSFDVRAGSLASAARSLSGGNQQKLIFAREVEGRQPGLLICHQPTRGVDIGAIELIHQRILELRNCGVGVLLISSELDELIKLSDRIYVLFDGSVSAEFARHEFDAIAVGAAMTGVRNDKTDDAEAVHV